MDREELVKELKELKGLNPNPHIGLKTIKLSNYEYEAITDFILADRKRICEPLVKLDQAPSHYPDFIELGFAYSKAVQETLRLAGMGENNE